MSDDMWDVIHAERGALADDLTTLGDEGWETPSLCERWSVRDVVAHMTTVGAMTPPKFFLKFAKARFEFDTYADREIAVHRGVSPGDTLQRFIDVRDSTSSPPGPKRTWLGETIVHAEDIRRPLMLRHDYPMSALVDVADFYKGSNTLIGSKKRIGEVRLKATDTDWTHGDGPLVEGPMISLVLAMTGRTAALADLQGEGVEALRGR